MSYNSAAERSPRWMGCTCSISCPWKKTSARPSLLRKWGEEHQQYLFNFLFELQIIASHQLQWSPCWSVTPPISPTSKHEVSNCCPSFLLCLAKSAIAQPGVVSAVADTLCPVSRTFEFYNSNSSRYKWEYSDFLKKAALVCWLIGEGGSTNNGSSIRKYWKIEN